MLINGQNKTNHQVMYEVSQVKCRVKPIFKDKFGKQMFLNSKYYYFLGKDCSHKKELSKYVAVISNR